MDKQSEIKLLHISDLHVEESTQHEVQKRLDALATLLISKAETVDFVLLTGDVAGKGRAKDYELTAPLLRQFLDQVGIEDSSRLVVVPGNHDVDRASIEDYEEEGLRAVVTTPEQADSKWRKATNLPGIMRRQDPFRAFWAQNGFTAESRMFDLDGTRIGFCALNSAWRSAADDDRDHLFMSRAQIDDAIKAVDDCDFRIALMHHPIEWLHESEQDDVRVLLQQNVHVICHGHRHSKRAYSFSSEQGTVVVSSARAIFATEYETVFSLIKINRQSRKLTNLVWRYEKRRGEFAADTSESDEAKFEVDLPPARVSPLLQVSPKKAILTRIESLVKARKRRINLLAPRIEGVDVNEFLEPQVEVQGDTPCRESVNSIVESDENWMIAGRPLSGKSTLLDLIAERHRLRAVAVIPIQFLDIPEQRVSSGQRDSQIARLIGVPPKQLRALLVDRVTLLIDNLDLAQSKRMSVVGSWLEKFKSLRVISTTAQSTMLNLASAATKESSKIVEDWSKGELGQMSLRQIRELGQKVEDAGLVRQGSPVSISRLVMEAFQHELPRFPWIVLIFFDLSIAGETLSGISLTRLLQLYTEGQLRRFEEASGGLVHEIGRGALAVLAAAMMKASSVDLSVTDAEQAVRDELERTGIASDARIILAALMKTGLVCVDGVSNRVMFASSVFIDFFYAEHLAFHKGADLHEMDLTTFRQIGGALSFLVDLQDGDSLIRRAFQITSAVAPSQSIGDDPSVLDVLNAVSHETMSAAVEQYEAQEAATSESDERIEKATARPPQRRDKQIQREFSQNELQAFTEAFNFSLGMLRNGTRLSKEAKTESARESIKLTLSLVAELMKWKEELTPFLDRIPQESDRNQIVAWLTAITVMVANAILTGLGAGKHLEGTLKDLYWEETDPIKRMMILIWYVSIEGRGAAELFEDFLQQKVKYPLLIVLQHELSRAYVTKTSIDGKKDIQLKKLLEQVTKSLRSIDVGGAGIARKERADQATQTQMRRLETTKRRISTLRPRSKSDRDSEDK